ncbi:glycosyltransferase [Mucilaginibacter sp. PAMB04168]|uniref:glycosyltransferase family 2 protein n=1 Tax=Mucilaginibacter sp. PAMB04168 TaxID=3138567 RepID=UPI0031F60614
MITTELAVIINSFNRLSLLKECLSVLSDWLPGSEFKDNCVAVVYDAGSKDGSVEWLQSEALSLNIPVRLMIPQPGDDTSFAAGLNAGVAYAISEYKSLKYLLFYETDNQILSAGPLKQAQQMLEHDSKLAACGFTVKRHDGSFAGAGSPFPKITNFALGKQVVHKFKLERIPYRWHEQIAGIKFSYADIVYTSPLLVKVKAWQESGGLDAQMFPFSDCDLDWAKRLQILGWKMGIIESNEVIHDNMQSLSAWSKSRAKQFHRGRLRYFLRHRPAAVYAIFPVVLMLRHSIELLAARFFVKDAERKEQLTGQFKGLLNSCFSKYE